MKRTGRLVLITVLVLGIAVFMTACSGGGGSSSDSGGGGVTSITTSTQGAKSAAASVGAAQGVSTMGSNFSGMGASLSSLAGAPALKAFAASAPATPVSRFAARFKPAALKARAVAAQNGTQTLDCGTGSPVAAGSNNSQTMTFSGTPPTVVLTMTAKNCNDGYSTSNGTMTITFTMNQTTNEIVSLTAALGSDAAPFTETGTSGFKSETAATLSITTNPEKISVNGRFEDWDSTAHTHSKQIMNNMSIAIASTSATIASAGTYSVDTMTINGGMSFTEYTSDTNATVKQGDSGTFANLALAVKTPVGGGGTGAFNYLSINGGMTIATIPAETCTDGTFDIVTNTDLKMDDTGRTVAGKMTINTNTVVTFNADGSADISLNGGAAQNFTEAQLNDLCPM